MGKSFLSALAALTLGACSQLSFAVVNAPSHLDGIKTSLGVAYGGGPEQNLDLYIPERENGEVLPVVVFIHGGRWTEGHTGLYKFVGSRLAKAGYLVVLPNYRKYPDVKFPEMMEDPAKAVAWVADHIGEYGGDAGSIQLMGHSSGAHMGALLAADERYLAAEGKDTSIIKSFVGLAGPYHFTPDEDDLIDMFGPPENFPQMQLGTFIDAGDPPMLMLWGKKDDLVGIINIENTNAAAESRGFKPRITAKTYPSLDHTGIMSAFTWVFEKKSSVVSDVLAFLKAHENN